MRLISLNRIFSLQNDKEIRAIKHPLIVISNHKDIIPPTRLYEFPIGLYIFPTESYQLELNIEKYKSQRQGWLFDIPIKNIIS